VNIRLILMFVKSKVPKLLVTINVTSIASVVYIYMNISS